jgi:outer membrane protein assembly factor BamB
VNTVQNDSYKAIVHKPLLDQNSIYFSNTESLTQKLNMVSKAVEWSFPVGSIADLKRQGEALFVGGSDGSIVSVHAATGQLKWKTSLDISSPIASLFATDKYLLASNKKGALNLLDITSGKVVWSALAVGDVVGEFFAAGNSQCLTYSLNAVRCFQIAGG